MAESINLNRRNFVKTVGVAAASVLLSTALPVSAQTNKRRRYAIIGTEHGATGM